MSLILTIDIFAYLIRYRNNRTGNNVEEYQYWLDVAAHIITIVVLLTITTVMQIYAAKSEN